MEFFCGQRDDDEPPEERLHASQATSTQVTADDIEKHKVKELFKFIKENNVDAIKNLIEEDGLDVRKAVEGPLRYTVLHCLAADMKCERGNQRAEDNLKKMFRLFISKECSVNSVDKSGNTPLKLAAEKGNVIILKCLLDERPDDLNYNDKYSGDTPLHWAAKKGMTEAVEILLEYGANMNAQNNLLQTPLYLAVENKQEDVVVELLLKGADKQLKCQPNKFDREQLSTVLQCAERNNFEEIVGLLKKSEEELRKLKRVPKVQEMDVEPDGNSDKKIPKRRRKKVQEMDVEPDGNSEGNPTINIYRVNAYDGSQVLVGDNSTFISNKAPAPELDSSPSNVSRPITQSRSRPSAPVQEESNSDLSCFPSSVNTPITTQPSAPVEEESDSSDSESY